MYRRQGHWLRLRNTSKRLLKIRSFYGNILDKAVDTEVYSKSS